MQLKRNERHSNYRFINFNMEHFTQSPYGPSAFRYNLITI